MKKFADLLNTLYFTSSHLDKASLLIDYFKSTPDPDRGYALAVMAGTLVFPTFKRTLIKELIQERIDPVLFELSYDYVGDMSDTIALLWQSNAPTEELPTLTFLIEAFNQLPSTKIKDYLRALLNQSNSVERWALLKLGTGSLRIGISERFLKNTLAQYGEVDSQDVEKVWHSLKPPYTELFAWLEKKQDFPLVEDIVYFHPVMLSHPLSEKDLAELDTTTFSYERKYDGIRVQVVSTSQGQALFTRTGDNISHSFPDVLSTIDSLVVLDGELVIVTEQGIGSFNQLQQRLNRKSPSKKLISDSPAGLMLYDILSINGQDLRMLPFTERRLYLEQWVSAQSANTIFLSEILSLDKDQTLLDLKEFILKENHPAVEGLMIKHKHSPYLAGRPKNHWFKWKRDAELIDAVIMYAQRGHGKRSSFYSDFTFGLWEDNSLLPIGKAYSGFTDEELLKLDRWVRHHTVHRFGPVREVAKELVVEVAFDAVNFSARHKSGVALRFPRINRIRWDKPAAEADQLDTLVATIKSS